MDDRAARVREIIEAAARGSRRQGPIPLHPGRARALRAGGLRAALLVLAVTALLPLARDLGPADPSPAVPVVTVRPFQADGWEFAPGSVDPGEHAIRALSSLSEPGASRFEDGRAEAPAL